jgi:hypothetical protein
VAIGFGLLALNACEENNPQKGTSNMQDGKPQASQHICPTDTGEDLDTVCSQVCGDIIIEPVGQLPGCGNYSTGFYFPNTGECPNECAEERYCIKEDIFKPDPCDTNKQDPAFACGDCDADTTVNWTKGFYVQKHYIPCRCCNGEVQCAEPIVFEGKNVTGDPSDSTVTEYPDHPLVEQFNCEQCDPDVDQTENCNDCCNGDGYKITYVPSKSKPSKKIWYYTIECL